MCRRLVVVVLTWRVESIERRTREVHCLTSFSRRPTERFIPSCFTENLNSYRTAQCTRRTKYKITFDNNIISQFEFNQNGLSTVWVISGQGETSDTINYLGWWVIAHSTDADPCKRPFCGGTGATPDLKSSMDSILRKGNVGNETPVEFKASDCTFLP